MALRVKKYKKSPNWQIRGTVAGEHVHETSHTTDRGKAEEIALKLATEILDRRRLGRHPPVTFADAATVYKNRGGETRYLLKLLDYFRDKLLNNIGQIEIDEAAVVLFPGAKASTINRCLISKYITIRRSAIDAELKGIELRSIKRRKEVKPIITPADDEHIDKLLPHCSDGLAALIILMTYTGLRTGEALRVKQEDCRDGFISVAHTKNGKPRNVPSPEGWNYPAAGYGFRSTQGVGRALRAASKKAGIAYRDGHELGRHAFAFRWLKAGHSLKGLKESGGWDTLKIVDEIYGHLEQTAVHETMRELSRKK